MKPRIAAQLDRVSHALDIMTESGITIVPAGTGSQARTETGGTMHVTQAQLIRRYQAPQYLVEFIGDPSDADDVAAINECQIAVLAKTVGWQPYTHILRMIDDDGDEYDYLASSDE